MSFFSRIFRKPEAELERLVDEIEINLSNNYKSVAHAARVKLGERNEELYSLGLINEEKYKFFRRKYETYTESMKNYHH